MISFDASHAAVHYPKDRRFRIWIRPSILIGIGAAILAAVLASWIEVAIAGLPAVPPVPQIYPNNFAGPHGFPLWVRYCHFFNFFFVMFLIRSGLSILFDHPRLYFNDDCTPGSEWIRFTPLKVPRDRIWTAKDDSRYLSPIIGTPGYRHTIGVARVWHFIDVHGFIFTGIFFIIALFDTEQWRRIVPTSPTVLLQAWNTWVHYATFHLPLEPNGFYGYNALQQIAYFTVVFVFGPLAIATGIAMSPAVVNRFPWYAKIFGGRQSARSIHFLTMLSFLAFLVVHVTLVVMTGFARNMNHIVMGTDDQDHRGMYLGFLGIGVVVLSWIAAHYISWNHPRSLQHALKSVTYPMHHCIQGWSGIAKWGGIPMRTLIDLVRPKPEAKVVAFFSFGEALYGGPYYDTQRLENVLKAECLLATQMNGQPLPDVYGAPLRLRVENQLAYKMVKWIERIEFVQSEKQLGAGEGGKNEDDEYFDLLPNI